MIRITGITQYEFPYTGNPVVYPDLKVYDDNTLLQPGSDYATSYYNNIESGIGCVHLSGRGTHSFRRKEFFTIYRELKELPIDHLPLQSDLSLPQVPEAKRLRSLLKEQDFEQNADINVWQTSACQASAFQASYFNVFEEKLQETQNYLLTMPILKQCITSGEEPLLSREGPFLFWECDYE